MNWVTAILRQVISFSSLLKNCGETKTKEEKSLVKWRINTIKDAGEAGGQTERSQKAVPGVEITSHEVGDGNVYGPQSVGLEVCTRGRDV